MKTGNKQVLSIIFSVVLLLSLVSGVYAITGSIGNAKMILRAETGETVERSILVKNVNDVALEIEMSATGDLENDIELETTEFTLEAGDERKAKFTISAKNPGTYENKINVKFSPIDGGDGVGLISTVILITEGESSESGGFFGGLFGNNEEEVVEGNQENGEVSIGQNNQEEVAGEVGEAKSGGLMAWGGGFTILLFAALLVVLFMANNHVKEKKGMGMDAGKSEKKDSSSKDDVMPSDSAPVTKSEKESGSNE